MASSSRVVAAEKYKLFPTFLLLSIVIIINIMIIALRVEAHGVVPGCSHFDIFSVQP